MAYFSNHLYQTFEAALKEICTLELKKAIALDNKEINRINPGFVFSRNFESPKIVNQKENVSKGYARLPRTELYVPFEEKDAAKALGAKWDNEKKTWYVLGDNHRFNQWMFRTLER